MTQTRRFRFPRGFRAESDDTGWVGSIVLDKNKRCVSCNYRPCLFVALQSVSVCWVHGAGSMGCVLCTPSISACAYNAGLPSFQASLQQTSPCCQRERARGGEGHRGENRQAIARTRGMILRHCYVYCDCFVGVVLSRLAALGGRLMHCVLAVLWRK